MHTFLDINTFLQAAHAHMHMYTYRQSGRPRMIFSHIYIYIYMCVCVSVYYTYAYIYTCIHSVLIHIYIYISMQSQKHTYGHTYLHTRAEWEAINGLLGRPCLVDRFTDAVFDLITLLDIDYKMLFTCQCKGDYLDPDHLIITYDNSCKLFEYILNRWPAMANHVDCVIDPLHQSGHVKCTPLYHSKKNLATKHMNSSLVEQKNKFIQHLASTVAHMGQIRVMVYIR